MNDCDAYKPLLMGMMDKELTSEELFSVNQHLNRCSACREEYEELKNTNAKIEKISFLEPTDRVLQSLWKSPYTRFTRFSSLFLIFGGYLLLLGYGLYEFWTEPKEELIPKLALAAITVGVVLLFLSVLRERLKTYVVDPYKEIER